MIFLAFFVLGVLAGLARHGTLSHLAELRLRYASLFVAALALHALPALIHPWWPSAVPPLRQWLLLASFGTATAALYANRRLTGVPVMWLGAALNALVMAANGGRMPISVEALRRMGAAELAQGIAEGRYFGHMPVGPDTHLTFLADIVPLGGPLSVPSVGDLLIGVGLALLVATGMTASPRLSGEQKRADGG